MLNAVYCSFHIDLWLSTDLSGGFKNNFSGACDVDLSIIVSDFHFLHTSVCCLLCNVCKDNQTAAYMKHVDSS